MSLRDPLTIDDLGWIEVARPRLWGGLLISLAALSWLAHLSPAWDVFLLSLALAAIAIDTAIQNRRPYWRGSGRGPFCIECGVDIDHDVCDVRCARCEEATL